MTTYNWSGDEGRYLAARHWGPHGVRGLGDTAAITQGEVVVRRQDVQATISIGNTDAGSPPVLDVRNSSAGVVRTDGNSYAPGNPDPNAPQPTPEYSTINVLGDSIRSLEVGSLVEGPAETTVNLVGHGTLATTFFVGNGSTLTVMAMTVRRSTS